MSECAVVPVVIGPCDHFGHPCAAVEVVGLCECVCECVRERDGGRKSEHWRSQADRESRPALAGVVLREA